jgi:4a-hydroxytetrahydrobiopterin dehydratase
MSRPSLLTDAELSKVRAELSGWDVDAHRLARSFRFADFAEAFGFMARIALAAEKLDHHPNWSNVYNRVEVELSTHDAGGVTALDVELARRMDAAAG